MSPELYSAEFAKLEALSLRVSKFGETSIINNELSLIIDSGKIIEVLTYLKNIEAFTSLIDICGVDYPERVKRFDVVYHLLSMTNNSRIRIKTEIADGASIQTAVNVWPNANWLEREAFDMYGILFEGHPDLRRILTDYGFEGYPLRKDFPLTGFQEVRYDEEQKRVVYEPVKLVQEFRNFDFLSPWEGMLPGDEKANAEGAK